MSLTVVVCLAAFLLTASKRRRRGERAFDSPDQWKVASDATVAEANYQSKRASPDIYGA